MFSPKPQTRARPCSSTYNEYVCCLALISGKKTSQKEMRKESHKDAGIWSKSPAAGQGLEKCSSEECSLENHSWKSTGAIRMNSEYTVCRTGSRRSGLISSMTPNMQNQKTVGRTKKKKSKKCHPKQHYRFFQQLQLYDSVSTFICCSSCLFIQTHLKCRRFCPFRVSENHLERSVAFASYDLISEKRDL